MFGNFFLKIKRTTGDCLRGNRNLKTEQIATVSRFENRGTWPRAIICHRTQLWVILRVTERDWERLSVPERNWSHFESRGTRPWATVWHGTQPWATLSFGMLPWVFASTHCYAGSVIKFCCRYFSLARVKDFSSDECT